MNRSINLISIVFVFVFHSLNVAAQSLNEVSPEQVGMSAERLARLYGLFEDHIEQAKIAGAVALIARRGKIAYFESFGWRDKEVKSKMQKDTLFYSGSGVATVFALRASLLARSITTNNIRVIEIAVLHSIDQPSKFMPPY